MFFPVDCVEDLFDRIGWNILYSVKNEDMLFDGFPKISTVYYPQKITDIILEKVEILGLKSSLNFKKNIVF